MIKVKNLRLLFLFLLYCGIVFSQTKNTEKNIVDSNKIENSLLHEKKANLKGYPITPFRDTLFFIYNKIGSFSAENRAAAITNRIKLLYDDPFYTKDSLVLSKSDISFDIVYKRDFVIMSVSDVDAKSVGKERLSLAKENLSIINKTILFQQENNSEMNWLKRIGLAFLLISIIALILIIINRIFRWFKKFLIDRKESYFAGFKIKESYIFSPEKQLEFALRIVSVIRVIVLVFTLYFSLPILFSVFPSTKEYASTLLNWIF